MSIFNEQVTPDYYVEHLRSTLDWIDGKLRDAQEREAGAIHRAPLLGYTVQVAVEARWLQQLIAELIGKHQIIMAYQRQCAQIMDMYHMHELSRPIVFPNPNPPPANQQKGNDEDHQATP